MSLYVNFWAGMWVFKHDLSSSRSILPDLSVSIISKVSWELRLFCSKRSLYLAIHFALVYSFIFSSSLASPLFIILSFLISSFSPKNAKNSSFVGVASGNYLNTSPTSSSEISVTYFKMLVHSSSLFFLISPTFLVIFQIDAKVSDFSLTLYLISFINASNPDQGLIAAYPGMTSAILRRSRF